MAVSQTYKPQKAGKAHTKRAPTVGGMPLHFIAQVQNGKHGLTLRNEGQEPA